MSILNSVIHPVRAIRARLDEQDEAARRRGLVVTRGRRGSRIYSWPRDQYGQPRPTTESAGRTEESTNEEV